MSQGTPPTPGAADLILGRQLLSARRFDLAEPKLRAALAGQPDNAVAHALLSSCLAARSAYRDAADEARESIRLAPMSALGYAALGEVAEGQLRWKAAEEGLRQALRFSTTNPGYRGKLAFILLKRGSPRESLAVAEEGLAIDPNHVGCLNSRALALVALGRVDEARQSIDSALVAAPAMAYLHNNLAVVLLSDGRPEAARDETLEALRLDPNLASAQRNLRLSQRAMGRPLYAPSVRARAWWRRQPLWLRIGMIAVIVAVGYATSTLPLVLIAAAPALLTTIWSRAPEALHRQPFARRVPQVLPWLPLAIVLAVTMVVYGMSPSSRPIDPHVPILPATGAGSLTDDQIVACLLGGPSIDVPAAEAGVDMPDARNDVLEPYPPPSDIADDPPGPQSVAWLTRITTIARSDAEFMLGCAADTYPGPS